LDPVVYYRARKDRVDIVDVPEFGYLMVDGAGAPGDEAFAAATQALYAVSYAAHFMVKKQFGAAPAVRPLEALWWVDDPRQRTLVEAMAEGGATVADADRDLWQWRAMICQPDCVDADLAERATAQVSTKKPLPALDRVRFERWAEGVCAQTLHIGPYSDEAASITRLHHGIEAAGCRPRGRHHEIYLNDPRRTAPEKVRTVLRQPVEEATLGQ
jgi:hypothetical protein